jgi:hypothetical protein
MLSSRVLRLPFLFCVVVFAALICDLRASDHLRQIGIDSTRREIQRLQREIADCDTRISEHQSKLSSAKPGAILGADYYRGLIRDVQNSRAKSEQRLANAEAELQRRLAEDRAADAEERSRAQVVEERRGARGGAGTGTGQFVVEGGAGAGGYGSGGASSRAQSAEQQRLRRAQEISGGIMDAYDARRAADRAREARNLAREEANAEDERRARREAADERAAADDLDRRLNDLIQRRQRAEREERDAESSRLEQAARFAEAQRATELAAAQRAAEERRAALVAQSAIRDYQSFQAQKEAVERQLIVEQRKNPIFREGLTDRLTDIRDAQGTVALGAVGGVARSLVGALDFTASAVGSYGGTSGKILAGTYETSKAATEVFVQIAEGDLASTVIQTTKASVTGAKLADTSGLGDGTKKGALGVAGNVASGLDAGNKFRQGDIGGGLSSAYDAAPVEKILGETVGKRVNLAKDAAVAGAQIYQGGSEVAEMAQIGDNLYRAAATARQRVDQSDRRIESLQQELNDLNRLADQLGYQPKPAPR